MSPNAVLLVSKMSFLGASMFAIGFELSSKSSYIYFGGYESSRISPVWTSVTNSNGFWELPTDGVYVNNVKMNGTITTSIIDTGTTYAYFPASILILIINAINKDCQFDTYYGIWYCTCNQASDIPPIYVQFGNYTVKMDSSEYVVYQSGTCYLFINDTSDSTALLGDAFIRGQYIVFDQANGKMAFSPTYSVPS